MESINKYTLEFELEKINEVSIHIYKQKLDLPSGVQLWQEFKDYHRRVNGSYRNLMFKPEYDPLMIDRVLYCFNGIYDLIDLYSKQGWVKK